MKNIIHRILCHARLFALAYLTADGVDGGVLPVTMPDAETGE